MIELTDKYHMTAVNSRGSREYITFPRSRFAIPSE